MHNDMRLAIVAIIDSGFNIFFFLCGMRKAFLYLLGFSLTCVGQNNLSNYFWIIDVSLHVLDFLEFLFIFISNQ